MTLLLWMWACSTGVEVEQSGPITCPSPEARTMPPFDLKQQPQAPLVFKDLHGGGLLVEDLDGDGWFDLFLPGEQQHRLRWGVDGNLEDLFEEDDAALAGFDLDFAVGATAVDYDGDGDLDVYVTRWNLPDVLLRNNRDRTFTDVTIDAFGEMPALFTQSASWGDIDADGDLDLFVGTYGLGPVVIDVLDPAPNCSDHLPDPALLWRNNGDGTFTDVSSRLPSAVHAYSFMSGFYDIDDDGLPELFSAHDDGVCGPSAMLRNEGGTFRVDDTVGFNRLTHDMGMGVADLNGDLLPDFLLTSWNGVSLVRSTVGDDGTLRWFDIADSVGMTLQTAPRDAPAQAERGDQVYGWGAEFGDLDNDADLDAVMVFGYWDYYPGAGDPVRQNDGVWIQGENGQFADQGAEWGLAQPGTSRAVVLADIDNDGYLDVLKRNLDDSIPLLVSRCGDAGWLRVRLAAPAPNTFAVGARIVVEAQGQTHVRWIQSGSAGMYSGGPLEAHFGLGSADTVDRIEVHWPDGKTTQVRNIATRQRVTLRRE